MVSLSILSPRVLNNSGGQEWATESIKMPVKVLSTRTIGFITYNSTRFTSLGTSESIDSDQVVLEQRVA
jgi:hypothetical protein